MRTAQVLRLLLVLAACTGSSAFGQTVLVIATNENPPTVSRNPRESFLTQILDEAAKSMGVRFDYQFMPWKRCEMALDRGEAWGAIPYIPTEERMVRYFFSEPLYWRRASLFLHDPGGKRRSVAFKALSDLKGYRIGGVLGYYYESLFREAGLSVEYVASDEQNFRKLAVGRLDLVPADCATGWRMIKSLFPPADRRNFYTLKKPISQSGVFLMVSRTYPGAEMHLIHFNEALRRMKGDGTFEKILRQNAALIPPECGF